LNAAGHVAVTAALWRPRGPAPGGGAPGRRQPDADPSGQVEAEVEAEVLLGAALPDLAAMGGFRLRSSRAHRVAASVVSSAAEAPAVGAAAGVGAMAALARGITLHHRTDEAFHRHRWFTERNAELYQRLRHAGFERGPARACSHVGTELLLDGELLAQHTVSEATAAALDAIGTCRDDLAPLLRTGEPDRWLAHLERLATHRLPADYNEPDAVAHRLHRIMGRRPRLAFEAALVPALTAALAQHQQGIVTTAVDLVEDLATGLAGPGQPGSRPRPDRIGHR
jgi:hypothetical protein